MILVILLIFYLIGSLNFSIIVGKFKGIDIKKKGSGNGGFTNTLRVQGKIPATIVIICDALKALIPLVLLSKYLKFHGFEPRVIYYTLYFAIFALVLGHNFPIYFKFKGGKGVVVSTISMLYISPIIGIIVTSIALLIMFFTRYISLGSIIGALMFFLVSFVFKWGNWAFIMFSFVMSSLLLYMHRSNIKRLIQRTERKVGVVA